MMTFKKDTKKIKKDRTLNRSVDIILLGIFFFFLLFSNAFAQNVNLSQVNKFFSRDVTPELFEKLDKLNKYLINKEMQRPVEENNDRDLDIWVVGPDQNFEIYPLTVDSKWDDDMPNWSPTDQKMAYVSSRTGKKKIWLMNSDGTGKKQLTKGPGKDLYPKWSPDGRQIAFVRDDSLYTIDISSGEEKPVAVEGSLEILCSWSRDSRSVLVLIKNRRSELAEINVKTGHKKTLNLKPNLKSIWTIIKLHPRNEVVIYEEYRNDNLDIAILNFEKASLQYLTDSFKKDFHPEWSSHGDKIAFASNRPTPEFSDIVR